MARREDFAVGMRVKCVAPFSIPDQFTVGNNYVVRRVGEFGLYVEVDDGGRTTNGWALGYFEPNPEPTGEDVYVYTALMLTPHGNRHLVQHLNEEKFNTIVAGLERTGAVTLAKKRIKFVINQ